MDTGAALLVFACVAGIARGELFTSMAHLQRALYAERDIALTVKQHIRNEEKRLEQLRGIADALEAHSSKALQNPDFYIGNPVNAFLFVKRFTLDWDRDIDSIVTNTSCTSLKQHIEYYRADLPAYEDLTGAAAALMRLQDTYKLDTKKIAQGDVGGTKSTELSADDCFEIGRINYNDEDFYHTSLWMEHVLDVIESEKNNSIAKADVLDYVSFSQYKQGNIRRALLLTNELLDLEPNHERAGNNKRYYEKMIEEEEKNRHGDSGESSEKSQKNNGDYKRSDEFQTYESLCRGEVTQVIKNKHKLKCRYKTNKHPLLILQPAREEDVHQKPWIVVYHDVMSDKEIEVIKNLATPRLNRATVQNSKTGELETAQYRISKSAWLKGEEHPVVETINRRIEAITGLNVDTAEELQIANYGIGGHYEPHFDFARKEEKDAFKSLGTGNRIATFLFYMSDIAAGGATVFPYIGVKLFPKKGTAAFWYNLYKNGEGIYDTRHAACPVLVGLKWVSNKWLHEAGQEFRRPCGLMPDE